MPWKSYARRLLALLLVLLASAGAKAQVYVAYSDAGIVNEYDADTGALIKERFLSRLDNPSAVCVDKGALYVLQGGVIGKYDAQTGEALNDHLVSGFRMASTMAVRDGVIYVSSRAQEWQFNDIGGGTGNIIARYDAITGACLTASLIQQSNREPRSLAVESNVLFATGDSGIDPNTPTVFDATTGTPIHRNYQHFLNGADAVTAGDGWIWFTCGRQSDCALLFKYSATSDASGAQNNSVAYFVPLGHNVHSGGVLAVSGDELFIQTGSSTAIAKYNATTGDLIKADFIPDRGDKLGGLAVIPRAASGQYALADAGFAAHNSMIEWWIWSSENVSVLYGVSGLLLVLVAVGMTLVYFHNPSEASISAPAEHGGGAIPVEPAPEPVPEPAYYAEIAHLRKPPPAPAPSFSGMALLTLFMVMVVAAGGLAWFAHTSGPEMSGPGANATPDMIGMWWIDPNEYHDPPIYYQVVIYPTRLEYYGNTVRTKIDGQWRNNGFWYARPDGSGEVEVCHLDDPLDVTIHLSAFNTGEQGDVVVYKQRGTDDEMKAMRDKYPTSVTYPPPAGVIKYGMSLYELDHLPWQSGHEEANMDDTATRVWVYRSDNPQVPELRVTLRNHRVVKIEGGNG